eukprot:798508-Amphidinium_carterae.1
MGPISTLLSGLPGAGDVVFTGIHTLVDVVLDFELNYSLNTAVSSEVVVVDAFHAQATGFYLSTLWGVDIFKRDISAKIKMFDDPELISGNIRFLSRPGCGTRYWSEWAATDVKEAVIQRQKSLQS